MPPLYSGIRPYILLISVAGSTSEVNAAIEQHRGILPVTDAKSLSSGEASQRDLARRSLPRLRISFSPTEFPPVSPRIERRPAIMAKASRNKGRVGIDRWHRGLSEQPYYRLSAGAAPILGSASPFVRSAHTKPRAWRGFNKRIEEGYSFWPVCIRFCWFVSAFARNT